MALALPKFMAALGILIKNYSLIFIILVLPRVPYHPFWEL